MKKIKILAVFIIFINEIQAQISNYNHYPSLKPFHILDDKLTDISFAFSMRVLESDYNGPLIRLRRSSDNAEEDFSWSDNDIVDINAINTWRNGSNVFVRTWYDQSGQGRNATQTDINSQPEFFPEILTPHFQGDGVDDFLIIETPNGVQDVTNSGNQGTVITVLRATIKNQHSFGVLNNNNRWSTHVNWSDSRLYFDPGICCNATRSFNNSSNNNAWMLYTFIKTDTNVLARSDGVERFNGSHTTGRCTRTDNFTIGWANGNQTNNRSTTAFLEFIMYRNDIIPTIYEEIENNGIAFWNL